MIETEMVKYGEVGIIIVMLIIAWRVMDFFLKRWLKIMDRIGDAVAENTRYLKKRNGSLEKNDRVVAELLQSVCNQLSQVDSDVKELKESRGGDKE